jgi:membrane protein YqaA with SNARE-associated domain
VVHAGTGARAVVVTPEGRTVTLDASPAVVLTTVILVAGIGGLLPYSPLEPLLVAVALTSRPTVTIAAVALATLSQMSMKGILFRASGRAQERLSARPRALFDRLRHQLVGRRALQLATVLVSAATGLPPLYLVTLVCGALRLSLRDYLLA